MSLLGFQRETAAQTPTFAGNAQHTAGYAVPAQHLNVIRWSTPIDIDNSSAYAHYGAPLVTPSNTVITAVKTTSGFFLSAFEGTSGRLKYSISNDYIPPTISGGAWIPVYQAGIATPPGGQRLYYPGAGGTVYYITNLDSDTPSAAVHECFYTNLSGYNASASAYNAAIVINTPITADTNGVIFFGFRTQQTAPSPFNTNQSGFARLDPAGNGRFVIASVAAGDSAMLRDSHNCAPALSNDGATLYVAVKSSAANNAYLLGLDSTTLATKYKARLRDPRNGNLASVADDGTASPMIAPDGDVFFGVLANPDNGSKGFLLHFSADLQTQRRPSAFGWDYTAAIVSTNMVPWYSGSSPYLVFSKYNNYAGNSDGNGINRIALLDPNANQTDAHPSAPGLQEMRELITVTGPTPDVEYQGPTYPYAVREWCINTGAVNPATRSIFTPSEDGHIYRWDLAANSLTECLTLGSGVGEPYVPTSIGPDGTIYTLNGGTLFAIGSFTNVSIAVYSSVPDVRSLVAGQPVTFTAVVSNLDALGPVPTGSVTFRDLNYQSLNPVTNLIASAVPLSNGIATATTSSLITGNSTLGGHFLLAQYSGDGTFPGGTAMIVQKVHAYASITTLTSAAGSNNSVTLNATVISNPLGGGTPTGMVTFWDHTNFLAQLPLASNGVAVFATTNLPSGSHALSATYASDTIFAASSGSVVATPPNLTNATLVGNSALHFTFSNTVGAAFTVLGSDDLTTPISNWTSLGPPLEGPFGQFQFTDPLAPPPGLRFYRVRSP